jgi:transcriptional regulator with XRE-family HTH domain
VDTPAVGRIGDYIKEQRETARLSLRRLAQEAGVSNPYLSQVERGLRKPSAEILQQLAKALRISAEQLYVQAGLLEDKGASLAVESAVLSDPSINERQKRVLLDIYSSFLAESGATPSPAKKSATPKASPRKATAASRSTRSNHSAPLKSH